MTAYLRPSTLDEALIHLAKAPCRLLAGGTDLYPATTRSVLSGDIIDIASLPVMRGVTATQSGLRIGACTTWTEIAGASLPPALRALQQAAIEVGGRQIQNTGTLGGNLCNASPAADGVPPLLAVDAQVELRSATGIRHLALSAFLLGSRQTARADDEVLTAIIVPQTSLTGQSQFLKLGARAYLVISIAMVAARLQTAEGRITGAALAVGACSATARRLPGIEAALLGLPIETAASRISETAVAASLSPLDDLRATAAYRVTAATELLRRAVAQAGGASA